MARPIGPAKPSKPTNGGAKGGGWAPARSSKTTPAKPQPSIKPSAPRKGIGPSRAPSRGTR